jgi:hypothetical protein
MSSALQSIAEELGPEKLPKQNINEHDNHDITEGSNEKTQGNSSEITEPSKIITNNRTSKDERQQTTKPIAEIFNKTIRPNEPICTTWTDVNSTCWPLNKIEPKNTLRLYHQNIRGAKTYNSWKRWTEGTEWLAENGIGIATLSETNLNWTTKNKEEATRHARKSKSKVQITTASPKADYVNDYLPGGSACMLLHQWVGRSIEKIDDESGMGRWTGFKLRGKRNKTIIVVSAYRPTRSSDPGDNTCFSQQWRIMRDNEEKQPDPRKKFITDLKAKIIEWEQQEYEIIIGIDANEPMDNKNSQIKTIIEETTLLSLLETTPQIATYDRGTKCIDYIFGTPLIRKAIKSAGYLPFYSGGWDSDHRALYIDIDIKILFGTLDNSDEQTNRTLSSKNGSQAIRFLEKINSKNKLTDLYERIKMLTQTKDWDQDTHDQLEQIDNEFTTILTSAEKECKSNNESPWSLVIHEARQTYRYWRKASKGKANRLNTKKLLQKMMRNASNPEAIWQGDKDRPIKNQLKRSISNLKKIEADSNEHRLEFLISKHSKYKGDNKDKQAKIIRSIQKAESKTRCYTTCRNINKPRSSNGGLTHVLVTNSGTIQRIDSRAEVEGVLHKKNVIHFSQAKTTPFANGRIADMFNIDGISETTKNILEKKEIRNVSKEMADMFAELGKKRETLSDYLPFTAMVDGFHKWRETTATSPSGKHLGIYRTLTNAYKGKYDENKTEKDNQQTVNKTSNYEIATIALQIQHHLLNLTIKHQHTLKRWQIVHNVFLEKILGHPIIEKLRVIHIYEADWTLMMKYFIAYKLHGRACRDKTVQTEQAGGRPGKSASNAATNNVITSEVICLQRKTGATLYNDAKACFDRIIENISNVTLMSEGLNPKIAKLHTQTLTRAKYHIKTGHGISKMANGHMNPEPFYGSGQGAADSMPRWALLSDLIIKLYNKMSKSERVLSPISHQQLITLIRAYVDDTNCIMICKVIDELIEIIQHNATTWERLLYLVGGKLELSKCKFTVYDWQPNEFGTMTLSTETKIKKINILDSETKEKIEIEEIPTDKPYKLLGIPMCPVNAEEAQATMINEKCNKMSKMIKMANLQTAENWLAYKTIVIPTITYGLGATQIPPKQLQNTQKNLTNILLPYLGYNRHTPRAMVYASCDRGGVGMVDIAAEQGASHIAYIIGSIRCSNETRIPIMALIEAYIISTGIVGNPLVITEPRQYINSPWMNITRQMLANIEGIIEIPGLNTIRKHRKRDKGLMDIAMKYTKDVKKQTAINNCRLYLQVNTLAEITNTTGDKVHKEAYFGLSDEMGPLLRNHSRTTMLWPIQNKPPQRAWKIWKKMVRTIVHKGSLQLKHMLSHWTDNTQITRKWKDKQVIKNKMRLYETQITTTKRNKKQNTEKLYMKIIQSPTIKIVQQQLTTNTDTIISWELISDNNNELITSKMERHQKKSYHTPEHDELLTIRTALELIQSAYKANNAAPNPNTISIYTNSKKVTKTLLKAKYEIPTIYSSVKNNAEHINAIIEIFDTNRECKIINLEDEKNETVRASVEKQKTILRGNLPNKLRETKATVMAELVIKDESINASIKQNICRASTDVGYFNYLKEKYNWTQQIIENIDWEALQQATKRSPFGKRKTLSQLMHGWLPTRGHPGTISTNEDRTYCPRCKQATETNRHFLICPHESKIWAEKYENNATKNGTDEELDKTIIAVITSVITNQNVPEIIPKHNHIIQAQRRIGMQQLLLGRYTVEWAEQYNQETETTEGTKWVSNHIITTWKHIRNRWETRCEIAHEDTEENNKEINEAADKKLDRQYKQCEHVNAIDKKIFAKTIEEMKNLPLPSKISWLQRTANTIKTAVRRQQKRVNTQHGKITKYCTKNRPSTSTRYSTRNRTRIHPEGNNQQETNSTSTNISSTSSNYQRIPIQEVRASKELHPITSTREDVHPVEVIRDNTSRNSSNPSDTGHNIASKVRRPIVLNKYSQAEYDPP